MAVSQGANFLVINKISETAIRFQSTHLRDKADYVLKQGHRTLGVDTNELFRGIGLVVLNMKD